MGVDAIPAGPGSVEPYLRPDAPRRRASLLLVALLLIALVIGLLSGPAHAQEPGDPPSEDEDAEQPDGEDQGGEGEEGELADQGLRGTLSAGDDRKPVEGATIVITDEDGAEVATVETDEEGAWELTGLELGVYTAHLDEATLPEGITVREGRRAEVEVNLQRAGRLAGVAFPLADEESEVVRGERPFSDRAGQAFANGLKFGLIIGMASIGLSLIFGTTGLINFAHGELVAFGAITAWFLNTAGIHIGPLDLTDIHIGPFDHSGPLPIVAAVGLAVLIGALVGGALERGMFRPLRARDTGAFQLLVVTVGLSLALRQALLIWFGERPRRYALQLQSTVDIGPVAITPRDLTVMGLALATLLAVGGLLLFTRIGKAMRAVSDNQDLAESSGIDVQRVILVVWLMGAGLAALGGSFYGIVTNVEHDMGFELLLLMFAAVILGGLGTAFGAIAGGIVIGLATELSTLWVTAEIKYVWALAALVLVLLVRPQGIFGVRERVG